MIARTYAPTTADGRMIDTEAFRAMAVVSAFDRVQIEPEYPATTSTPGLGRMLAKN
jgi:hypothetical protein